MVLFTSDERRGTMNDVGSSVGAAASAAMLPPTSSANSFPGNGRLPHVIPMDESADLAAASRKVRIVDELPPLSSIEQKPSGISSTGSSLSDGIDGSNTAQDDGVGGTPNNNPMTSVGGDLSTAIESDPATKAADKKAAEAKAKAEQQKHKKKNSLKSIMKKRPASSSGESRESLAQSSSSSALSSSRAGNSSQSRTSIGWGWFEHNSSNVLADSTKAAAQEGDRSKSGKSSKKKKKRGGMLQGFSSAILGEQIEVPINQNEPTSIAVTAPQYILEESIDSQKLWKQTAGKRPPQPAEERAYFEKLWSQNFVRSQVQYEMPVDVLTATSPISLSPFGESGGAGADTYGSHFTPYIGDEGGGGGVADVKAAEVEAAEATLMFRMSGTAGASQFYSHARTNDASSLGPHHYHHTPVNKPVRGSGDGSTVVVKGDNVFGTTVSKSFPNPRGGSDTISVSIASYRVVKSRKEGQHAQFLVVYRDGSFRETIGVWKRFSDFERLANKVSFGHESCNVQNCSVALAPLHPLHIEADHDVEPLPNAITSWKLLKKRQRWFRCLDAGYLSLKVFLLERFLHDILFESTSPRLLREFVGVSIHSGSKTSLLNAY